MHKSVLSLQFHALFALGLLAPCFAAEETKRDFVQRPNIVLIMADDLGVEGVGCYGGTSYSTPNIDRMAAEGMRFTHAYAQPLCTNTRIQLMTSRYNHRNWIAFGILDPKARTIGHWMKEAGYATCIVGKWQLQSYDPPDYPGAAKRRGLGMKVEDTGFDEYSLWHTAHTEDKGSRYADPVIYENGSFRKDTLGKYGPDIWTTYIDDYLKRHRKKRSGNKDAKPFFIYYPMALPHWPFVPTPDSKVWSNPKQRHVEDLGLFRDMVQYTDKVVGRVVDSVDKHGFGKNTLILFYSDNGTHLKVTSQTKTGPVKGGKGLTTDAGTHVPFVARWTGTIRPSVNDELIDSTDFAPTIREAAGFPLPKTELLDGISFFPQLMSKKSTPRQWIYCHFDPRPGWDKDRFRLLRFARNKRFKLYTDGRLYDIRHDRLELHPIERHKDTAESGRARDELAKVFAVVALKKGAAK